MTTTLTTRANARSDGIISPSTEVIYGLIIPPFEVIRIARMIDIHDRAVRRGGGRLRGAVWLYSCLASEAGITAVGESYADPSRPHFVMVSFLTNSSTDLDREHYLCSTTKNLPQKAESPSG